jgi:hypothetical protein
MKKTLSILALIAFSTFSLSAQNKAAKISSKTDGTDETRHSYLGLTSGINNIGGMGGVTFETPISDNFSAKLGAGLGLWGLKFGLAGKYYKQYAKTWSFGAGYSTASGFTKIPLELRRQSNPNVDEKMDVNFDRSHTVDFVAGRMWGNKVLFGLELGYAIRVAGGTAYTVDKSIVLADDSANALKFLRPGGLIVGVNLIFRL